MDIEENKETLLPGYSCY